VVFEAKPVDPRGEEKRNWDWCYKSSWPQKKRKHEGEFLWHLRELPCVVDLLAYGVVRVEGKDDTTIFGRRQCSSGESMALLDDFHDRANRQGRNFTIHSGSVSGTATSGHGDLQTMLSDPRRPSGGSPQECDVREHRDVVIAWVNWSFNEAASLLHRSPNMTRIWQQAFLAIKSISEKGVLHRDISFRNIRIDDAHQIKVCDFDMATFIGGTPTGAKDRTGTIAFMATSTLSSRPYIHRPVHDCESVFWLCALNLLGRVGVGGTRQTLAQIMNAGMSVPVVRSAKKDIILDLSSIEEKTSGLKSSYSLDDPRDSSLFFCLTGLAREFLDNRFSRDYERAKEGFESACFDRCIEIIQGAFDPPVQQAIEGIARMSLSS